MRLPNGEKRDWIPKVVQPLAYSGGRRCHQQLMRRASVVSQSPGSQVRYVIPDGDGNLVLISSLMNDSVSHPAILIGYVCAWSKYVSEILSAQEGRSFWIEPRARSICNRSEEHTSELQSRQY